MTGSTVRARWAASFRRRSSSRCRGASVREAHAWRRSEGPIKDNAPSFEIIPAAPKPSKKRGKKIETGEAQQGQSDEHGQSDEQGEAGGEGQSEAKA
jgi:hypothetical protein